MATGSVKSAKSFAYKDVISNVRAVYTTITANDGSIVHRVNGDGLNILDVQFKTSAAIGSGSVDLSSVIPSPLGQQLHAALASSDGKTGWMQLTATGAFYIRCEACSSSYMCGQLVYQS